MMSNIRYILVFLSAVPLMGAGQYRCDYIYNQVAGGYLKFHRIPANWQDARLRCHLEGAKLASPLNFRLQNAMLATMVQKKMFGGVFTGIHSTFSKGDYSSIEGITLNNIPHTWADNEPNNYKDGEDCLVLLRNGKLADVNCSEPFPYFCYKKTPEELNDVNACGTNDNAYSLDSRTGNCYKFHTVPRTWSRAYMACRAEGAHLAIINSDIEAEVIKDVFARHPSDSISGEFWKDVAFMGFHDIGFHGDWMTVHGDTLQEAGYAKFANHQPDNADPGEQCGSVFRDALYNDIWCNNPYVFICEKTVDSINCDNDFDIDERFEN